MATRWFVFWMACFMVAAVKDQFGMAMVFLIFAMLTSAPESDKERKA